MCFFCEYICEPNLFSKYFLDENEAIVPFPMQKKTIGFVAEKRSPISDYSKQTSTPPKRRKQKAKQGTQIFEDAVRE